MIIMTMVMGFLLFLVLMLNSAATGSEGEHQEGPQSRGHDVSRRNLQDRGRLSCPTLGGQCTKKKDTCPIWLPLKSSHGRPNCRNRKRCCYRDSCPNPIFEAFHVCAECSSSEDALDFVKELWGQPSTNPRNTTVFDGHNITYTRFNEYNYPSCRSSFVDSWDCHQNATGYWTYCRKRNGNGGRCTSDHALNNGHLFNGFCDKVNEPQVCCYQAFPHKEKQTGLCSSASIPGSYPQGQQGCGDGYMCYTFSPGLLCGADRTTTLTPITECEPRTCDYLGKQTGYCSRTAIPGFSDVGQDGIGCKDGVACYVLNPRPCYPSRNSAMVPIEK